jgi:hypothetical protein
MSLIDKIRQARRQKVTVDGHEFTVRRPTEMEALPCFIEQREGESERQRLFRIQHFLVANFVDDWDVKEIDLYPGGPPIKADFDREVLIEFLNDRQDTFMELANVIIKIRQDYLDLQAVDEKKSETGLSQDPSMIKPD